MSKQVKCVLRCASDSHDPILLPHLEEVILGRCPQTKIVEKRCSRNQLTFKADTINFTVDVKQTGANFSAVNGVALGRNCKSIAHHGDSVHFILGQFEHVIEFDPAPSTLIKGTKHKLEHIDTTAAKRSHKDDSITSSSSILCRGGNWDIVEGGKLLVYESPGLRHSKKIAAYDMDGTLIVTKSGKVFPQYPDDWKIMWPEIPAKLKALHNDGYKVVIFTNQAGISRGKTNAGEIRVKIQKVIENIAVPAQAFVATGVGLFRKPAPGMWDILCNHRNGREQIDKNNSFYCGDAAGRLENWAPKKKKDFSCSDCLFARNLGLTFFTPEEHFLGWNSVPVKLPDFDPGAMANSDATLIDPPNAELISTKQELLLLCGFPGSGKSFFCREYLIPAGYKHVNRDTLGSWQKCVAVTKTALEAGISVVVDNTNPDPESRSKYIEVASRMKIQCRCAVIGESIARARHNNKFRELIGETHEPISEMIMNSYKSKYKEPLLAEGFHEIIRVNFIPKFKKPEHEQLYRMYLLDKY